MIIAVRIFSPNPLRTHAAHVIYDNHNWERRQENRKKRSKTIEKSIFSTQGTTPPDR